MQSVITQRHKYAKDSTVVLTRYFDSHRVKPNFSVFRQKTDLPIDRVLVGEFTDETTKHAKIFADVYLDRVQMEPEDCLVIMDHRNGTEFIYHPRNTIT